ncbi:MFS transporter [Polycladidibacter hongkongensis]|uniref:MFS transporter n=1 Tax=Polycladidibacter hongkongensis TaxID=1647556 RepID=UPI00082A4DAE|nr:MFS transporter [Pseudovibrio hongkongensis]
MPHASAYKAPPPVGRLSHNPTALTLLLIATLTVMANATISPALPGIAASFSQQPHAKWLTSLLVSAPSASVILVAPFCGWLADQYGRRALLLSGLLLFALAGSAGLYLPTLWTILASRLLLGIAVALIMSTQTALIGDLFSSQHRNILMGLQTSARNLGGLCFISLASLLALFSPFLPFAVYKLSLFVMPFAFRTIPSQATTHVNSEAGSGDVATPRPPQVSSFHLLFLGILLLQMATNTLFFVMPTQIPFILGAKGFNSPTTTGLALGSVMLAGGLSAVFYARLRKLLGASAVLAAAFLLMAVGFAALPSRSLIAILCASGLIGAGYALAMPAFPAIMLSIVPAHRRGLCSGLLTTSVFMGQVLSVFISMPLFKAVGEDATLRIFSMLCLVLTTGLALAHGTRQLQEQKIKRP